MDSFEDEEDFVGSQFTQTLDDSKSSAQGKYHKQSYRKAWESLPDFKGWLKGVDGEPTRAFCTYCRVSLFAHRISLLKHTCTLKHQRAAQKVWLLSESKKTENGPENEEIGPQSRLPVPSATLTQSETLSVTTYNPKLNPTFKALPGQAKAMTVTIIQEGTDEPIQLDLKSNIEETDSNSVVADEDLGLLSQATHPILVKLQTKPDVVARLPVTKTQGMAHSSNYPLSTHVLDTSKGKPVAQLCVSLYRLIEGRWTLVNEGFTTDDGRCTQLIQKSDFVAGRYKLHFDTDRYFQLERKETLYPFIEIVFDVHAPSEHYHIPLLLSPFGYSTYRGS